MKNLVLSNRQNFANDIFIQTYMAIMIVGKLINKVCFNLLSCAIVKLICVLKKQCSKSIVERNNYLYLLLIVDPRKIEECYSNLKNIETIKSIDDYNDQIIRCNMALFAAVEHEVPDY